MPRIEPYYVAIMQLKRTAPRAGGMARFRQNVEENLKRYAAMIDLAAAGPVGGKVEFSLMGPVRLVTFFEFSITGSYAPTDYGDHRFNNEETVKHLAIAIPGPETDVLAEKAKQRGVYVAAANIEKDPAWPGMHFNTGFIINPKGKVILKYRKTLVNNPSEIAATAHDLMNRYKNPITGDFNPFPVVDTAIGRMGLMICADFQAPEIPRLYSIQGADMVIHLTSGNSSSDGGLRAVGVIEAVKRARGYDNAIYFVNSNCGPRVGGITPEASSAGYSAVIDYLGQEVAKSEDSGETVIRGRIDIEACRAYRRRYYSNYVTMVRSELYAPYYSKTIYPANTFLRDGPIPNTLDERQKSYFRKALANLRKCENFYSEDVAP